MEKKTMKERLYEIVSVPKKGDYFSIVYDVFFILVILVSLIPLCFREQTKTLILIDQICAGMFIMDYLLRWMTADYTNKKWGKKPL